MKCEHKHYKQVRNYGKNSKPSYLVCCKCGKILTMEDKKQRKWKRKKKKKRYKE